MNHHIPGSSNNSTNIIFHSKPHRPIKSIVPYKININSTNKYLNFIKKGCPRSQVLDIEYLNTNRYNNPDGRILMQLRLVKILKKAHPMKMLRLHKCIVQYENIPIYTLKTMVKRTSQIRALSLPYYAVSQDIIGTYTIWLKQMRRLKRFDYVIPMQTDFPDGHLRRFELVLKKFIHAIKRTRVRELNISHNIADDRIGNSFIRFHDYPSTLRKFTFDWRHFVLDSSVTTPETNTSLCHMNKLTSLKLAIPNQDNIIGPTLTSIPNYSQLTNLDLQLLSLDAGQALIPFTKLNSMYNLSHLKLKFNFWPQGLDSFLRTLKSVPLKKFILDTLIEEDENLFSLKDFISRQKELESLKLKISKFNAFENRNCLRSLFENISRLQIVKKLELGFFISEEEGQPDIFSDIIPNLRKLFKKSALVQEFTFKCNQIESGKGLSNLIALIFPGAANLRKLKINVGDYTLEDHDYKSVNYLIENLKAIESLKLVRMNLFINQLSQAFFRGICELKSIQNLELGELRGALNKQYLVRIVEKVLSKRGLEKFDCVITLDSNASGSRSKRCWPQINLKNIFLKNPALQKYPFSTALFACYEDENDYKWTSLTTI